MGMSVSKAVTTITTIMAATGGKTTAATGGVVTTTTVATGDGYKSTGADDQPDYGRRPSEEECSPGASSAGQEMATVFQETAFQLASYVAKRSGMRTTIFMPDEKWEVTISITTLLYIILALAVGACGTITCCYCYIVTLLRFKCPRAYAWYHGLEFAPTVNDEPPQVIEADDENDGKDDKDDEPEKVEPDQAPEEEINVQVGDTQARFAQLGTAVPRRIEPEPLRRRTRSQTPTPANTDTDNKRPARSSSLMALLMNLSVSR